MFGKIQANLERFFFEKLLHLFQESIFRGELLKPLVSGRVFFSVNLNITRSTSWGNLPLGILAAFLLFLYFVSQTFIDEVFLRPERKDEPRKIGAFLALLLLLDWAIHFWTMLSNRFDSSFLLARRNHLHQENVGFWQTLMCLGLAFLLSTFNIFPIFHLLVPSKDFPILMGIWFLRFMGFPFFLQPFLGTILLLDLEIRELSNRLKDVAASNDLQLTRTFVQEVVGVKSKWARFLQAQLALGLLQPLAYTFTVLWPLKLVSCCWRKY